MASKVFKSIKAGLEEALAYAKGEPNECTVRYLPEEALRENPIQLSKEKPTKRKKK